MHYLLWLLWYARIVVKGLPEGIAALRRDANVDLVLFGDRVTFKRQQRRLIEVGFTIFMTHIVGHMQGHTRRLLMTACTALVYTIVHACVPGGAYA